MKVNNSNINLTSPHLKNPYIYNPIKSIVFGVLILFKSPILSLSKNSLLLVDKSVLQHPPSIINQSSKAEISAKKKKKDNLGKHK